MSISQFGERLYYQIVEVERDDAKLYELFESLESSMAETGGALSMLFDFYRRLARQLGPSCMLGHCPGLNRKENLLDTVGDDACEYDF